MSTKYMVKKASEMTVEEKLSNLYKLQMAMTKIDEKRSLRGELPLEVHNMEDELEGLRIRREKIENEIDQYQQAINLKRGELATAESWVERYKSQLDDVRNNREYDTLTKEIEYQSLEIELCHKKIKEAQAKIDEKQVQVMDTTRKIEVRAQDLILMRSELDEIMAETREEEELLREEAHDLEQRIEPRLLSAFKRIRKSNKNGLGIVYVQRDACGGCFSKIPAQRQLDVKLHKKVIVCEYCGRILIDPELAGVRPAVVEEEKPKRRRGARRKSAEGSEK